MSKIINFTEPFNMYEFNNKSMKKYIGPVMFQRGMNLYLTHGVSDINIESNFNEDIITGIVENRSYSEPSTVEIILNKNTGEIKFDCNCYDFKKTSSKNRKACKHILATFMRFTNGVPDEENKIEKKHTTIIRERDYLKVTNPATPVAIAIPPKKNDLNLQCNMGISILEQFEKLDFETEIIKTELKLTILYGVEHSTTTRSFIELKFPTTDIYDIKTFLKAVKLKNIEINYSNYPLFNPNIHCFNFLNQQILDLLVEIYEIDEASSYMYNSINSNLILGKKVYLSDNNIKRLFKLLEDENISLNLNNEILDVKILKEDLPLTFNVTEKALDIYITYSDNLPIALTKDNEYFLFNKNIYKPSLRQIQIYSPFYKFFLQSKENFIKFNGEHKKEVINYTLPQLEIISDLTILSENINIYPCFESIQLKIFIILKDDFKPNTSNDDYRITILVDNLEDKNDMQDLIRDFVSIDDNNNLLFEDQEKLLLFLSNKLEYFKNDDEIILSNKLNSLKTFKYSSYGFNIYLDSNNLITIYFTINGVNVKRLKSILNDIKEHKSYCRLSTNEFIYFNDEEFIEIKMFLDFLNDDIISINADNLQLFKYKAVQIEKYLLIHKLDCVKMDEKLKEFISQVNLKDNIMITIQKNVNNIIKQDYELKAFKWLKNMANLECGGIIADKRNKMFIVLAFIISIVEESINERKKTIIITDLNLISKWKHLFDKFASELKVSVISDKASESYKFGRNYSKVDVIITTVDNIEKSIFDFKNIFTYCFIEETTFYSSKIRYLKNLNSKIYFALTTNNVTMEDNFYELWAVFNLVLPLYLDSESKFLQKYVHNKNEEYFAELKDYTSPFILENFILTEGFQKLENPYKKLFIEMSKEQQHVYLRYLSSTNKQIDEEISINGFIKSKVFVDAGITRIRQLCSAPSLFTPNNSMESAKMLTLDELLEKNFHSNRKIIICSRFLRVLKFIQVRLINSKIPCFILDQTYISNLTKNKAIFPHNKNSIFLVNLKEFLDLSLLYPDLIIDFDYIYDLSLSEICPQIDTTEIELIKLITVNTIEESLYDLSKNEKYKFKDTLNYMDREEAFMSLLNKQDIKELLSLNYNKAKIGSEIY